VVHSPLSRLIFEEQKQLVHDALRRATPSQQRIARLLMNGLRSCDIASRLGVLPSAVTHTKERLRPLLLRAT
jgi:DNA-binding NarL/FixJ family response regulator